MISYTIKITGTQEEIAKIKKLGDKLLDMSSLLKSAGDDLKTYYSKTVFGAEGSVEDIGRWQALSPAYKKWKGKHYPNRGILIASGDMQKSFKATNTHNSLTIENTDKKFAWHQLGTRRMPARPMLVINSEITRYLAKAIKADVEKKIESLR